MKRTLPLLAIAILSAATIQGCATQSDLYSLENYLTAKIRDQETLTEKKLAEGRQLRDQSASLGADLERIREDIQALSGKLDEKEHQLNGKIEALDASVDMLSARLNRLDGGPSGQAAPAPTAPASAATAVSAPIGDKTETELYEEGKKAFEAGESENAKKLFQIYLEKYPKSKEADNAQFWLAEIFFRDKWYEKAILEYQKVIENYPKGNKVADALWKQGLAFLNLNEKVNAKLIWEELVKKFPGSSQAQLASQKLKSL